ncbi:MAG: hypothetical protein E7090_02975 [Bacteroidales bacterium]|nr:hypothetical protein [Bacteroidales bacterium]
MYIFVLTILSLPCHKAYSQVGEKELQLRDSLVNVTIRKDSLMIDSIYNKEIATQPELSADSSRVSLKRNATSLFDSKPRFVPNPQKATWLAVVFPGAGQIYNRKYWKLPIVYGGFIGCLYAYNWNSQMYSDYRQGYLDIMDSDPNTKSYEDFFRPGYDFENNKEYIKEVFKKRKDRYRRWRDLSVFAFVAVYALSVIDAYVDAQLSNFDISDDINMTLNPQLIRGNGSIGSDGNYYGLNCNITF